MPLAPVQLAGARSRAQEVYEWLRAAILSGALHPHERLVETTIAELAAVSRTPVREALSRLRVDGLVGEGDRGGLEVAGLSLGDLAELCAVRETLEGMATELAALSRSELEVTTLRRLIDAEREALDAVSHRPVEERVDLNHAFHEALWRASRNRYLAEELRHLRSLIERLQPSTLGSSERLQAAIGEHRAIVEAVEARDASNAGALARRHFRNAMAERLAMARETPGAASPPTPLR